jgi:hypothetical protein
MIKRLVAPSQPLLTTNFPKSNRVTTCERFHVAVHPLASVLFPTSHPCPYFPVLPLPKKKIQQEPSKNTSFALATSHHITRSTQPYRHLKFRTPRPHDQLCMRNIGSPSGPHRAPSESQSQHHHLPANAIPAPLPAERFPVPATPSRIGRVAMPSLPSPLQNISCRPGARICAVTRIGEIALHPLQRFRPDHRTLPALFLVVLLHPRARERVAMHTYLGTTVANVGSVGTAIRYGVHKCLPWFVAAAKVWRDSRINQPVSNQSMCRQENTMAGRHRRCRCRWRRRRRRRDSFPYNGDQADFQQARLARKSKKKKKQRAKKEKSDLA